MNKTLQPGPIQGIWQTITDWIDRVGEPPELRARLDRNYVLGDSRLWLNDSWETALKRFQADLDLFGIQEANE